MAKKIRRALGAMLSLPPEVVLDLPVISMIGSEEINIENYKGIIEYGEHQVRVKVSEGVLKIEGRALTLRQITSEYINIKGAIKKIELIK